MCVRACLYITYISYQIPPAQEPFKIQTTVPIECLPHSHYRKVEKLQLGDHQYFVFSIFYSHYENHIYSKKKNHPNSTKGYNTKYSNSIKGYNKNESSLYPRLPSLCLSIKSLFSLLPENFPINTHKSSCE